MSICQSVCCTQSQLWDNTWTCSLIPSHGSTDLFKHTHYVTHKSIDKRPVGLSLKSLLVEVPRIIGAWTCTSQLLTNKEFNDYPCNEFYIVPQKIDLFFFCELISLLKVSGTLFVSDSVVVIISFLIFQRRLLLTSLSIFIVTTCTTWNRLRQQGSLGILCKLNKVNAILTFSRIAQFFLWSLIITITTCLDWICQQLVTEKALNA